jgi:sporulation protein YlmC with PRC-barrel domain
MRFSEASGRKVVSTSTAETVGRIEEFVIDPRSHSVVALELKRTDTGDTLRWSDIVAFGVDAVTVTAADKISDAGPDIQTLTGKAHRVLGKRVLSTRGDELGRVADVEFDPETAAITAFQLDSGDVEGVRLIGIGSYAVVVHAMD